MSRPARLRITRVSPQGRRYYQVARGVVSGDEKDAGRFDKREADSILSAPVFPGWRLEVEPRDDP